MKGKLKKIRGITLIALVVTIVVLLILAGASIAMLTGDNGRAREENIKGEIKEELELEIANMRADKASKGEELTKQEVIDNITEKGVIIIDSEGDIIQGEYKDYEVTIDKNYNITVGGALIGEKPKITIESLNKEDGVSIVQIKVTASTTEGEIATIEATNGAVLKTDTSSTEKIFEVAKNGKYYFKVKGTNGRTAIQGIEITNIIETIEAESLLEGINKVKTEGNKRILVKEEVYMLNVVMVNGRLELSKELGINGKVKINGVEKDVNEIKNLSVATDGKTYSVGNIKDIGTASANAKNTVALKVDGDLTIGTDVTLTSISSAYGGTKGMVVYCTGTLNNNGTISMTGKGAKASGQNVYMWKNQNDSYEFVPRSGATGGTAASISGGKSKNGNAGANANSTTNLSGSGVKRSTAGGGAGGVASANAYSNQSSSSGGTGTSYGAGGGGGGVARHSNNYSATPLNASGVSGGNGALKDGSYNYFRSCAGGGAGSPAGAAAKSAEAKSSQNGETGTGGLLIVYTKNLVVNNGSLFSAEGKNGGGCVAGGGTGNSGSGSSGGGASGGGSINIFMEEIKISEGTIASYIKVSGGTGGSGTGGTYNARGGNGGTGSCNIGYITTGTYQKYYSNN